MATTSELVRVIRNQFGGERCIIAENGMHGLLVVKDRLGGVNGKTFSTLLQKAEAEGKLVVDREGGGERISASVTCIRVPEKLRCKRQDPSESEASVATGRSKPGRVRGTTYPRTAEGADLPGTLPNRMVGPVTVSAKHTDMTLETAYIGLYDFGKPVLAESEACEVVKVALGEIMNPEAIPPAMPREVLRQLSCGGGKLISEVRDGTQLYRIPELAEEQKKEPEVVEKLTGLPTAQECLESALEMVKELQAQVRELEAKPPECTHGDLEEKLGQAARAGLEYKNRVAGLEAKIRQLQDEAKEAEEQQRQLQRRIEDAVQKARGDETALAGLRRELKQAAEAHAREVGELNGEITDLREQLAVADKKNDELEAKLKGGGTVREDTLALFNELVGKKKN